MDHLLLFIDRFMRQLLIAVLFIGILVLGLPTIVVLMQHHTHQVAGNTPTENVSPASPLDHSNASNGSASTTPSSPLITLGWENSDNQLASYQDLHVVSPLFATLDDNYDINLGMSASQITKLHQESKKVWGRVTLSQQSDAVTHQFLTDAKGRAKAVQEIATAASDRNVDGINLDIEQIAEADRQVFGDFVKSLSESLQKDHITLSIDLQPESSTNQQNLVAYNQLLGKYCDYIVFMGYDLHWSTDPTPGPVTSLEFLTQNIQKFLRTGIPAQKLLLGLPSYTRIWQVNQNGNTVTSLAFANEYVDSLLQNSHNKTTWDPKKAVYYSTYQKNGKTYKVWLTNDRSLETYLQLIDKYHLGGMGFWSLDMMSSSDWNQLIKQYNAAHKDQFKSK